MRDDVNMCECVCVYVCVCVWVGGCVCVCECVCVASTEYIRLSPSVKMNQERVGAAGVNLCNGSNTHEMRVLAIHGFKTHSSTKL